MKILVIGSGGREHALCWKLRHSPHIRELYCAPGNPGIGNVAKNVSIKVDDLQTLLNFAASTSIDLTIVGPELPLSLGIVDLFQLRGLKIFGPSKAAARLESSKSFAKEVMRAAKVPTADFQCFDSEKEARRFTQTKLLPYVLKADGLAAGKGVVVCKTKTDVDRGLDFIFRDLKSDRVVIEDFLEGREASLIVAAHKTTFVPLAAAHDYKRIRDYDEGPNTGGMGTVSPTPHLSTAQEGWAAEHIIQPVLHEMDRRGEPFTGFLYAGLMIAPNGAISVVEFNARLGDPECQVIMRRMQSDLCEILLKLLDEEKQPPPRWKDEHAVCVVMASAGYPETSSKGDEIIGVELTQNIPEVVVFHAGTSLDSNHKLVTAGGRVLNITATGKERSEARSRAYRGCDMIQFKGQQLRRDIGA